MQNAIDQAKAGMDYSRQQLEKILAQTPEDRLNWSPSPTARTPIEVAVHIAMSFTGILLMLQEKPRFIGEFGKGLEDAVALSGLSGEVAYPYASIAELEVAFRAEEKKFRTRTEVMELMDREMAKFKAWMETLTPEQFEAAPVTFFGPVPIRFGITLPAMHAGIHISQIEYIQTIYGDMERH